jgi:hypothetical protein
MQPGRTPGTEIQAPAGSSSTLAKMHQTWIESKFVSSTLTERSKPDRSPHPTEKLRRAHTPTHTCIHTHSHLINLRPQVWHPQSSQLELGIECEWVASPLREPTTGLRARSQFCSCLARVLLILFVIQLIYENRYLCVQYMLLISIYVHSISQV